MVWTDERTLGKTGTEETRDLLDEGLRGQERIVLLGELLDELLVLVEPMQADDIPQSAQQSSHDISEPY